MTVRILIGDVRERLRDLPDESVHCVVTSPPYFGLRDYGVAGQIGLEQTPAEFVATLVDVFREVRRVLRADGTCWINLGDSYANTGNKGQDFSASKVGYGGAGRGVIGGQPIKAIPPGLKPKDLIGIPWAVATALRAPYYAGRIKSETDRAWLAGFLDGEGTISFVERDRGPDHTPTHDVRVFLTNCDDAPLRHFASMTAGHVYEHDGERESRYGARPCFRWQMGTHDGALLVRELFPYLRTKRKQAALVWTLYTTLRHRNGHARTPAEVVEKRRAIADMVRALNRGEPVDVPSWIEEPPSATEPGWYLRQDLIWHKPNPMPESVTDRCTKAHEYLFLLTKSARYHFDAAAIAEAAEYGENRATFRGGGAYTNNRSFVNYARVETDGETRARPETVTRNRRSVWTVATEPFKEAHFATFPPSLVEPCILAGCPKGGTVLDPFGGAGTTGLVADRLQRDAILIELNPAYAEIARRRLEGDAPMFAKVEAA